MPPPPPPPEARKETGMQTIAIILIVIVVVIIGISAGPSLIRRVMPPRVQVTSNNYNTGFEGLDYTLWVYVTVYNSGGPGTVTVYVEASQGSNSWRKSQTIYLDSEQSSSLTFTLNEVSFWNTASCSYTVWVES